MLFGPNYMLWKTHLRNIIYRHIKYKYRWQDEIQNMEFLRVGEWALKCEVFTRYPITFMNNLNEGLSEVHNSSKYNSNWRVAVINEKHIARKIMSMKWKYDIKIIDEDRGHMLSNENTVCLHVVEKQNTYLTFSTIYRI